MPFEERSIVSQREEFCRLAGRRRGERAGAVPALSGSARRRPICGLGGMPAEGREGLENRSRRPLSSPNRTPDEMEARVVAIRLAHPAWGGRKIRRVLETQGCAAPPSASTITEILRRHGLLEASRRPCDALLDSASSTPRRTICGRWTSRATSRLRQGRCHPLTVLDDHSRYALELGACADEQTLTVRDAAERGVPPLRPAAAHPGRQRLALGDLRAAGGTRA